MLNRHLSPTFPCNGNSLSKYLWAIYELLQFLAHSRLSMCWFIVESTLIHWAMMTSSNGNIFRITGPFVRGNQWSPVDFPHKGQWRGASDAELWCFLWCAPEHMVGQTVETPVVWNTLSLNVTLLKWPGEVVMRRWSGSLLVWELVCQLFGAKPSPEHAVIYQQFIPGTYFSEV